MSRLDHIAAWFRRQRPEVPVDDGIEDCSKLARLLAAQQTAAVLGDLLRLSTDIGQAYVKLDRTGGVLAADVIDDMADMHNAIAKARDLALATLREVNP